MPLSRGKRVALTGIGIFAALPFVLVGGLLIADKVIPSNVRKALPNDATDVHEYYEDNKFFGDFARYVKAKIPESEMPEFARKLSLSRRYSPHMVKANFPLDFDGETGIGAWWHPSPALDSAYIEIGPGTEAYSIAKYENGYVYFKATSW